MDNAQGMPNDLKSQISNSILTQPFSRHHEVLPVATGGHLELPCKVLNMIVFGCWQVINLKLINFCIKLFI